jgi:long-chain acyl-CoA synthetase
VKDFAFLDKPFSLENNMLTPKMSQKRPVIAKEYKELFDSLYASKAHA